MEWLAAAIAIVAAGATFWQASEARAARKDAKGFASDAKEHEEAARAALAQIADSSARTATATENIGTSGERAADALAELATRIPPWELQSMSQQGDSKLVNVSAHSVVTSSVAGLDDRDSSWFSGVGWEPSVSKEWTPHDWETVRHEGAGLMAAPSQITILVLWKWAEEGAEAPDRRWKGQFGR